MKDKHTVGKKWPEMVVEWAIVIVIRFYSDYRCKTQHICSCISDKKTFAVSKQVLQSFIRGLIIVSEKGKPIN